MGIFERIHRIELQVGEQSENSVNVFVIEDSEPMMIDTGPLMEGNKEVLKSQLRTIGYRLEDFPRIVLTHGHVDHYGLAQWISNMSQSKIYIHREDVAKVRKRNIQELAKDSEQMFNFFLRLGVTHEEYKRMIEPVKRFTKYAEPIKTVMPVDESISFAFQDFSLRVIHFPGHTSGSLVLWSSGKGLFFSGDSLLPGTVPVPLIEILPSRRKQRYRSLVSYLSTVRRICKLNLKRIYPGHGDVTEDVADIFHLISEYYQKRREEILDLLSEEKVLPNQIVQRMLSKKPYPRELEHFNKLSEVVGILEVLEEERVVESFEAKGKIWYRRKRRKPNKIR